jgi:hypothetical protein
MPSKKRKKYYYRFNPNQPTLKRDNLVEDFSFEKGKYTGYKMMDDIVQDYFVTGKSDTFRILKLASNLIEEGMNKEKILDLINDIRNKNIKQIYSGLRMIENDHISSLAKIAYIQHVPGHVGSDGTTREWTVKDHKTNKIIQSYKTKEEAEKALKRMQYFKNAGTPFFDDFLKEKGVTKFSSLDKTFQDKILSQWKYFLKDFYMKKLAVRTDDLYDDPKTHKTKKLKIYKEKLDKPVINVDDEDAYYSVYSPDGGYSGAFGVDLQPLVINASDKKREEDIK